jgi:hypothetical protein
MVTRLDGTAFLSRGGDVLAANPAVHAAMLAVVQEHEARRSR